MPDRKFQAAVFDAPNRSLSVETLEMNAEPGRGEVVVRLRASGVCHSDLHVYNGEWGVPSPMVLGHEGAGVVEQIGAEVETVAVGDHVVLSWTPSCRKCVYCISGRPVLCELVSEMSSQHLSFDGHTRLRRHGGENVHSLAAVGTFGEFVMVPETGAIPIRKDAPFAQASLVGCAVTTGIGAVINTARVRAASSVLVVGCGGVGLNVVQGARLAGARQIIAADVSEDKLSLARKFGATHTINSASTDLLSEVFESTAGAGVDYAFEAIGLPHTIELCYEATARGGMTIVVGQVAENTTISIDPYVMSDHEKSIVGSNYGSSRPAIDFPRLIDLYMNGQIDLDSLVTNRIPISGIDDAFADMSKSVGVRTVIEY